MPKDARWGSRLITALFVPVLSLATPAVAIAGTQAETVVYAQDAQDLATLARMCSYTIDSHDNVVLDVTYAELAEAGFARGDIVDVTLDSLKLTIPICGNFREVPIGDAELTWAYDAADDDHISFGICLGNFVRQYGLDADGAGQGSVDFSITMREPGGYQLATILGDLDYSVERADFPDLTDAEFANFREVTAGDIAPGRLYRSASPVDPRYGRNTYADACLRGAGVTQAIDLKDTEEVLTSFEGYAGSLVSGIGHVAVGLPGDFTTDEFDEGVVAALTYMADNPGVYDVFCREGMNRTGFVCALLECLMGATKDEVVEDYMQTFVNYYGLVPGTLVYEEFVKVNLITNLERRFGVETLEGADLVREATDYLVEWGMDRGKVDALKQILATPVAGAAHHAGAGTTQTRQIVLGSSLVR